MTRSRLGRLTSAAALAALLVAACGSADPSNPPGPASTPSTTGTPAPPTAAAGSPTANAGEGSSLVGIGGFFALSVADLEATAAWYQAKLGLEVASRPPTADGVAVVVLEGNGLTIELIRQNDGVSLGDIDPTLVDRTLLHGIVKAGVIVADFEGTVAMLRANEVPIAFGPFAATADQPANVIIEDNEGNLIQLIGP